MKNIVILGSSGLAKEIYFLIKRINSLEDEWNVLGFVDVPELLGSSVVDKKVILTDQMLLDSEDEIYIAGGLGFPKLLKKVIEKFEGKNNLHFPNLIDPSVIADWKNIHLGVGNIFAAGNILTTDIIIDSFNIFNLNSTIGHDVNIGSYNIFNPTCNISGNVSIINENLIGTGAQILQNLKIGSNITVGIGSVIINDLTEEGIYFGIPARRIK